MGLPPALERTEIDAAAPARPRAAPTLGRFVLLRELGAGAMGIVYAAYDEELDRRLAVKVLHTGPGDSEGRARSLREAQAMARVSHPNVVQIYEVGTLAEQVFVAMEFIDGGTLGAWQRARPRAPAEILHLYLQAGRGLAAAHAAGLVHRDFKPENVLIGRDGRVRVGDFGLARAFDRGAAPSPGQATSPPPSATAIASLALAATATPVSGAQPIAEPRGHLLASPMTVEGAVVGTPAYMSPEQHCGAALDARSDQFSFCAALYEALYGQRPFAGETLPALVESVLGGALRPPPAEREVPPWILAVVQRGLAREPAARWPDMAALLAQLDRDLRRDPSSGGRERRGFAIVMTLSVVVTSTTLVYRAVTGDHSPMSPLDLVLTAALAATSILVGVLVFGRTLLKNHFHRDVVLVAAGAGLQMVALRSILAVADIDTEVIVRADLAATVPLCLLGGVLVVRWYFIVAAVPALGLLLSFLLPGRVDAVAQLIYPALVVTFLLCWNSTRQR